MGSHMLFKRRADWRRIVEGAVFERRLPHNYVERATVMSIGHDPFGIPHIRFKVCQRGADAAADMRVLAAQTFAERYMDAGAAA